MFTLLYSPPLFSTHSFLYVLFTSDSCCTPAFMGGDVPYHDDASTYTTNCCGRILAEHERH
jgi:hypothetical protein